MIYILENDILKVKISSIGAELQSIRRLEDDTEYLWQGDATYWANRATNLFPFCGRNIDGKYTYAGETYEVPIHGFAKLQEFTVVHQKADGITFRLTENEETLAMYPFRFVLEYTYTLVGETLNETVTVRNADEKELIFAIGGHPGFNLPLNPGDTFEDYTVEFDDPCAARRLSLSSTCFYLNDSVPFALEEGRRIPLRHELFDDDAIFLRDVSKGVTLSSPNGPRKVHLSYPDMPFVGLWHKPHTEAPYVCIEPWRGVPALDGAVNALEDKPEMERLAPEGVYRNTFSITFG